jgi:hypothetical protein
MLTKTQVSRTLDRMPDEFSMGKFIDELIFISESEKVRKQSDRTSINSEKEEQMKQKLSQWLK